MQIDPSLVEKVMQGTAAVLFIMEILQYVQKQT